MNTNIRISIFLFTSFICFILLADSIRSKEEVNARVLPGDLRFTSTDTVKYLYVGMEKCASVCHNNEDMGFQYNIMKNGPHSNSYKILVSDKAFRFAKKNNIKDDPQKSKVCLKCHITGGGLDSTFFSTTYRKEEGVTCEACHKAEFITKAFIPKEADCLRCHNNSVHKVPGFNFREDCSKIAHPRQAPKIKEI